VHLSELARRHPDKPAVIRAHDGAVTTYAELDRRSLQIAHFLDRLGLRVGDHAAVLMDNRPEYLEVLWGCMRAGIYVTPVNWHLTEGEAAYVVNDCGARVLFTSDTVGDLASRVAAQCAAKGQQLATLIVGGGNEPFLDYATTLDGESSEPRDDEREGFYFFYSSGTTGLPKGIEPNHTFPPFGTGLGIDHAVNLGFGFDDSTTYLCPAPMYHAAPAAWTMGAIRNGGTAVLMERFDARECLRAIETYWVTHVQFVPTMFVRMLKLPDTERLAFDLSSLKLVVHAAAPCPVDVKLRIIEWFGPVVVEYYAGSEQAGMTMIASEEWLTHQGSVGRPVSGALHILDEEGNELAPGEIGVVYFEGGGTFRYYKDDEKTARAFNAKGWSTLGDLGYVDEEGYLYLADRRTDLILTGGVNVYPREIEEALVMHPAVADVAVIGVPDEDLGERVKAVVQLATGVEETPELRATLAAHARERLAGFKCPREWEFMDQLPRTEAGKMLRRRLRDA
jgi:acyl-CoA synthetase (AMP-forming)/AMP-acid ligase II